VSRSAHPVPADLLADAFAAELGARLPRLADAAARLSDDPAHSIRELASDAHALASSAAVLGEDVASYAARECELLLAPYADLGEVPTDVAVSAAGAAQALCLALAHWVGDLVPAQRECWRPAAHS
jgi:hypothetical protein